MPSQSGIIPLTRTDDLFDKLNGAKYFSSLDLGYHQIRIAERVVQKIAFSATWGPMWVFGAAIWPIECTSSRYKRNQSDSWSHAICCSTFPLSWERWIVCVLIARCQAAIYQRFKMLKNFNKRCQLGVRVLVSECTQAPGKGPVPQGTVLAQQGT